MTRYVFRLFLLTLFSALCACSATSLTGTWVNPNYQGERFHKILVLGVCDNETYLRIFEDALCREFRKRGIQAEPGYSLFPEGKRPDRDAVLQKLSALGFDAMMISQVTGRRTEEIVHPGYTYSLGGPPFYAPAFYYRDWYDYYSRSYDLIHEPAYISRYKVVTVLSNIYDTKNNELIWSATSETVVDRDMEKLIDSLVNTLIQGMTAKGLL